MMQRVLLLLAMACLPWAVHAKEAEFVGGDPELHHRVMEVAGELRCLVCQGQSLADSHSEFAIDMREYIQEMMEQGMTNREVVDFMVERYGDYVRYRPPFKSTTVLLWFGPLLLLGIGIAVLYYNILRRKKVIAETPLTQEEQRRAEALLKKDEAEDRQA